MKKRIHGVKIVGTEAEQIIQDIMNDDIKRALEDKGYDVQIEKVYRVCTLTGLPEVSGYVLVINKKRPCVDI